MNTLDRKAINANQLWVGCPGLMPKKGKPWCISLPDDGRVRQTSAKITWLGMPETIHNSDDGWLKLSSPSFLTVALAIEELIARGAQQITVAGIELSRQQFWHQARQAGLRRDQILGYAPNRQDLTIDNQRSKTVDTPSPSSSRRGARGPKGQLDDLAVAIGTAATGIAVGGTVGIVKGAATAAQPLFDWLGNSVRQHQDSESVNRADLWQKNAANHIQGHGLEGLIGLARLADKLVQIADQYQRSMAAGKVEDGKLALTEAYKTLKRYQHDAKEITKSHFKRLESLPIIPNRALFDCGTAAAEMTKLLAERSEIKALPPAPGEPQIQKILGDLARELLLLIREAVVGLCNKLGLTALSPKTCRSDSDVGPPQMG